jgi:hypothetical protein
MSKKRRVFKERKKKCCTISTVTTYHMATRILEEQKRSTNLFEQ